MYFCASARGPLFSLLDLVSGGVIPSLDASILFQSGRARWLLCGVEQQQQGSMMERSVWDVGN